MSPSARLPRHVAPIYDDFVRCIAAFDLYKATLARTVQFFSSTFWSRVRGRVLCMHTLFRLKNTAFAMRIAEVVANG